MTSIHYPKVLVIGQYFNTISGGGITMGNLFRGWDKQCLAVAAEEIVAPDFDICNNYYQIGSHEIQKKIPFNLVGGKAKSGPLIASTNRTSDGSINSLSNEHSLYLDLLKKSGLIYYKSRYKLSEKFSAWIESFSPEVIYTQLASIELIEFVQELNKTLKKPIVVHMMDDWPETIAKQSIFAGYWRGKILSGFKNVLSQSAALLSISEAMSDEYKKRYGFEFIPFHNPTDLSFWGKHPKETYETDGVFKILYAGRIGTGIRSCFTDLAEAIAKYNGGEKKIEFIIQNSNAKKELPELEKYDGVRFRPSVSYDELPAIFSSSDALLLPNDFDDDSIRFLRYSMPTKASEFMISGTPVFLFAHEMTAVSQSAKQHGWAYVLNVNNTEAIVSALRQFCENDELRITIAKKAKNYATENFEMEKIQTRFRETLLNARNSS